ncbi:MAG: transcription termination/antitermination protein NusA [Leptospiraceae bacterium]|nr:transcription termination/antitermination protein NusA [Leptospiraceae bacterium]MCP5497810.1 transcription termination/antitermination protein NusA [Leptospiraceae bacterium]
MAGKNLHNEPSLFEVIQQFCSDRGLTRDAVLNVIKESLAVAYKKKGVSLLDGIDIGVDFNDKNEVILKIPRRIVDKKDTESFEMYIEDAKSINGNVNLGDIIYQEEKPIELSRIVSNQVRQMVFQRIKEMERENLYNEYKAKEGDLIHGFFQRWKTKSKDVMVIDLGKVEAIMPKSEQNPGERYRQGERLKAIIAKVELRKDRYKEPGPTITLSRASADFVRRLFEMEIPEIYDGLVQIIGIARQPSIRSKVIVKAARGDIDPVGACVGMKGVRIQSIVRELGNERIDIIQYSENPVEFLRNLISPAKPTEVRIDQDTKEALIVVPDDSLSSAIGSNGSNVKLAAQLCQYKIDIRSESQFREDLSSPEVRDKLERLFNKSYEETEMEGTSLTEIPGLTPRIISLLTAGGVVDIESLIEMNPQELAKISGIGRTTAEHIMKLLAESVELVEES